MESFRLTRTILSLALVLALGPSAPAGEWAIVKGAASTGMDSLAAAELQRYVEQMTGKQVPIITDKQSPSTTNVFLVGKAETNTIIQDLAVRKLITISATDPGPQGFINKTVDADGKHYVVLAGCDELGAQYAVYDFLESYCKVGFLLDGDNVPSSASLEVKNLDVSKKPFCAFRQQSVYGKGKFWYGSGTWTDLSTFEKDGYRTGWKDFIDWMIKKKQNVLYLKRGFFNIGYILAFPELNNPTDIANIDADGYWFKSDFTASFTLQLIAYAKSRAMKTCYTATLCRIPDCFKKCIADPKHPCYGLKFEDMGSWLRLDPLDDRTYTYCLKRHVDGIISKFGKPDFWYGYYGWSEQAPTLGLQFRSQCHYNAYRLVFQNVGGALIEYTWDWGWSGIARPAEWNYFKSVMPKDGSVILGVNDQVIPNEFLNDPAGPFAGYPWWKYLTSTNDDQCLPETYCSLKVEYDTWNTLHKTCAGNLPQGFGLDNMIHHVDQRLTDFESDQSFYGNANTFALDDYLAEYARRAYTTGPSLNNLYELHKLWRNQRKVTHAQVEQYMVPEWFRLKNNIIYRTDLTEALYYDASDFDKCALIFDKWIYSVQFTNDWANANIPNDAWVNKGLWTSVQSWPSDMTYENKAKFLGGITSATLTVRVVDKESRPVPATPIRLARGYLSKIKFQEPSEVTTNARGEARVSLKPDIYELTIPRTQASAAVLMLHNRDTTVTISLEYPTGVLRKFAGP
jgi:hypothetical protein